MDTNKVQIDEDEIDIKELFRTIYRYRYMIIFLVILFTIASSYYAYFKPNVYRASTTVEVGVGKPSGSDMLNMAVSSGAVSSGTEKGIIQSRFLAEKAAKNVDILHRYYTTRNLRELELYKESPFEVGMLKGYGISFDFYPIDEKTYRLVVDERVDKHGVTWHYDEILSYGKEIVMDHFHLNIIKTKKPQDAQYRFVILNPANSGSIAQGRVHADLIALGSTIIKISYEDNVALRAKEFTDALAQAYIQQNIEKKTKEATQRLDFIDKQLKFITENLNSSAIKLEDFKKTSNTVDLSSKAKSTIERLGGYETQLMEISMQQEMLNTLYKQVRSGKNIESITIAGLDLGDSPLSGMMSKLQDAVMKKKILREDYTEMYPEVAKLRKQIIQFKKVIIATVKNLRANMKEKRALIEKSIVKQQKLLNQFPAAQTMHGKLQRKFAINEQIYSYLFTKRLETSMIMASTVSKNRIIDSALTPGGSIKPKRKMIVLVGMILGFILGIALAFLRNFLDDRIKEEEDITKGTHVPLLGLIPNIKEDNNKIKVFLSPKSAIAESFRNLRTNLQFMAKEKDAHVIAVTSTVGGEGKTTICVNLGGIMSMAEKKTVILNLDMRKPTLHQKFGLKNGQGMSTLLSGSTNLGDVIQHTEYENLDIISSGPVPPNPSELIQSVLMEKVLEKLKEVYDVIILDTPPIGLVTDARTLMHFADTSIYVLRADHSKKDFLRNIEKLSKEEISGLGILLNDVKMNRSSYGYGYGYGYGYYEEDKK